MARDLVTQRGIRVLLAFMRQHTDKLQRFTTAAMMTLRSFD